MTALSCDLITAFFSREVNTSLVVIVKFMMVCGNMEVESAPETFMDDLYDSKEEKVRNIQNNKFQTQILFTIIQVRSAVATLKNSVIGSQRQKNNIVEHGVIARLIHLLVDPEMNSKIKTDVVYILGSIINGSETNLKSLNEADLANILLQVSIGHSLNNITCNL